MSSQNTSKHQTYIIGKDAALEDSISSMLQKLQALDITIIEQSWLNPIANVWSVHIRDKDCPLLFTNGKGASKKAALASALGEFFERLSTHYFWADYYLGDEISKSKYVHYSNEKWFTPNTDGSCPEGVLNTELQDFYNPDGELDYRTLYDINASSFSGIGKDIESDIKSDSDNNNEKNGNQEKGFCCLPYVCQRTQETVYFPVNIIGNLYVSNGMSAGNTAFEARVQALSEIFERFVKFKIIADGVCLPDIPQSVLQRYPKIQSGIDELESAGFPLLIKDASLGGKYPVICVTLLNPENKGCYASFGAHPSFEVALERSLTELLQGRGLDALNGFAEPGFDLDEIASPQNLETHFIDSSGIISWEFLRKNPDIEFNDWHTNISEKLNTTEDEFNWLCECIHQESNDIFISDHQELGVYACRILVPGLSEIYPVDDLVWENNNVGVPLRSAILKQNKTPIECQQLLEKLEKLNLDDQHPVAALIGLPADKASIWSELRVAELITLLALQSGDEDRTAEGCQWLLHFKQISAERLNVYACIDSLLQLKESDKSLADSLSSYSDSLVKLYGKGGLDKALSLISGDNIFILENQWEMHALLTDAYKKINNF